MSVIERNGMWLALDRHGKVLGYFETRVEAWEWVDRNSSIDDFDDWLDEAELFEILDRKVQMWRAGKRMPQNPHSRYDASYCGLCWQRFSPMRPRYAGNVDWSGAPFCAACVAERLAVLDDEPPMPPLDEIWEASPVAPPPYDRDGIIKPETLARLYRPNELKDPYVKAKATKYLRGLLGLPGGALPPPPHDKTCAACGARFKAMRSDAQACSPACRQRLKRRKTETPA